MKRTTHLLTVRAEFDAPPSIGAGSVVEIDGQRGALRAGAFYDLFEVERIYEAALEDIKTGDFLACESVEGAADHADVALDRADEVRMESSRTSADSPVSLPSPSVVTGPMTGGTDPTAASPGVDSPPTETPRMQNGDGDPMGPWTATERPYIVAGTDDGDTYSGGDWYVYPADGSNEAGPILHAATREYAVLAAAAPDLYAECDQTVSDVQGIANLTDDPHIVAICEQIAARHLAALSAARASQTPEAGQP